MHRGTALPPNNAFNTDLHKWRAAPRWCYRKKPLNSFECAFGIEQGDRRMDRGCGKRQTSRELNTKPSFAFRAPVSAGKSPGVLSSFQQRLEDGSGESLCSPWCFVRLMRRRSRERGLARESVNRRCGFAVAAGPLFGRHCYLRRSYATCSGAV